jgi:hypothetical protein
MLKSPRGDLYTVMMYTSNEGINVPTNSQSISMDKVLTVGRGIHSKLELTNCITPPWI